MHSFNAVVNVTRSSPEALAGAFERGAKDRLRDSQRLPVASDLADWPADQRREYAEGWLEAFKAELRQSASSGES